MRYQAVLHYKNDEEVEGPIREDFFEALSDLGTLVTNEVTSNDGFDPEDLQFAQVANPPEA